MSDFVSCVVRIQQIANFNYAIVWGKSVKQTPQRCGIKHQLCDEDVVQIFAR